MAGWTTTVDLRLAAKVPQKPEQATPAQQPASYYDDTQLKASALVATTDAAGYSSQAQSPQRLLKEGPNLTANALRTHEPVNPEAAMEEHQLREDLQANPESFEANHRLGKFYLSMGRPEDGIPYLEMAEKLRPGDSSNGYDLAMAYLRTQRAARARDLLQELIRQRNSAELHHALGEVDEALGSSASAVEEFRLAATMTPSEKNILDWGNELLLHGVIEPAADVLKRGVALYPNSLPMYVGLGIAFYSANSYEAAVEALCHASDLDPSDPRPYIYLGKVYSVSVAHADEVTRRMIRFMETNPDNALAYYYGALTIWKSSRGADHSPDMPRVEALFRKSITLDPRLADAHLQLGIFYSDQHRDEEAVQELQAAARLNPDGPDAHYRLAQVYLRLGEKERAEEELQLYEKLHKQ
jgi:tetratricopeptide (TPR) repeat protein